MKKLSVVLLLLFTVFLYTILLDRTPIHLNQDELGFSLNAYSIAKTGFDENGRFFPLYFWHLGVMWATPFIVYLTALFLKFLPLTEITIRLPSVLVALINVALIYLLAKKLFKSHWWGVIAGALLALTPVHFIQGRILLDNFYIVPFVLGWLLFLFKFLEGKQPLFLLVLGLILGFGFYSYHAARIMMPFYLLITIFALLPEIKKRKRLLLVTIIGFVIPLLPLIPWTQQYPETLFLDQVRYTGIYDTSALSFGSGIAVLLSPESLAHRLNVFVSYFNPVYLFLLGDASLIHSTSLHHPLGLAHAPIRAGVFLLPLAIFIPLGLYKTLKERTVFNKLIVFGFFTAPIAGALAGDHFRYSRILVILPFAILLAVYGIQLLVSQKKRILRIACYLLLITTVLHFFYFLYDYHTDYRIRSYNWMKYNVPGALEEIISQDTTKPTTKIFLDNRIEFIDRYWRFYLIKHNKEGLLAKTDFFDPQTVELEKLAKNSIILYNFNHVDGLKTQIGPFTKVTNIFEPDGVSTFYLYRN